MSKRHKLAKDIMQLPELFASQFALQILFVDYNWFDDVNNASDPNNVFNQITDPMFSDIAGVNGLDV